MFTASFSGSGSRRCRFPPPAPRGGPPARNVDEYEPRDHNECFGQAEPVRPAVCARPGRRVPAGEILPRPRGSRNHHEDVSAGTTRRGEGRKTDG